jgi:hypothetical protein
MAMLAAEKKIEHIGETAGAADRDHDMIHDLRSLTFEGSGKITGGRLRGSKLEAAAQTFSGRTPVCPAKARIDLPFSEPYSQA